MNREAFFKGCLLGIVLGILVLFATEESHAADGTREKPTDWATWAPPGSAKGSPWQLLGSNERGVFYLTTWTSPMLGYTFTLKQVSRGLSGAVTQLIFDDFTVHCGPHGEPPDTIGAIGTIVIDAGTQQYLSQYRSDLAYGDPVQPVPGSVLARATIVACYARSHS